MSNLSEVITAIGHDIGDIKAKQSSLMTVEQAYGLFPTYNNFMAHVIEQNQWQPDPIVLKSQLPTSEIEELKKKVADLERMLSEIQQSIQK